MKNNLLLIALTLFMGALLFGSCTKDDKDNNNENGDNGDEKGVVTPTRTSLSMGYDDVLASVEFASTRSWSVTLYDGSTGSTTPSTVATVSKTTTSRDLTTVTGDANDTAKQKVYVTLSKNRSTSKRVVRAVFTPSNEGNLVTVTITQGINPIDPDTNPITGIETTIPSHLGEEYVDNFNRYTKVTAQNGGAIHIVAQSAITDEQIVRCRSILQHYLTNYPGSLYGANKSMVTNKMASNGAILCLLNGEDDGNNPVANLVSGQPLYQNEIQVEGGDWYMNQNYDHRDASYEEILHLVHDMGIGVDGTPHGPTGALPAYQTEIRDAQENAVSENYAIWPIGGGSPGEIATWFTSLTAENSLSQEYLAAVVDAYYGLWGAWSGAGSMWGLYKPKVREDMAADDSMGDALMNNKFFHPYLTYNARIDPGFNGTFSLKFDASKPYTNHSRYLKDITLTGDNDNNVIVNELDNNITGNAGTNTVIFSGAKSAYTVQTQGGVTTVSGNGEGVNTLSNIEKLSFNGAVEGI